jgi:LmbE family N-acetylglucosaminyl deacetylase
MNIFISPHFDDICFSLSGFLIKNPGGIIVNVFSKTAYMARSYIVSKYFDIFGYSNREIEKISYLRNEEDKKFIEIFNLSSINLGFEDSSISNSYSFEIKLLDCLITIISHFEKEKIKLFFPMGVGGHSDHVAIYDFILKHLDLLSSLGEINFYFELPYSSKQVDILDRYAIIKKDFKKKILLENKIIIEPLLMQKKIELAKIYKSQFSKISEKYSLFINFEKENSQGEMYLTLKEDL